MCLGLGKEAFAFRDEVHALLRGAHPNSGLSTDEVSIEYRPLQGEAPAEWFAGSDLSSRFAKFIWGPRSKTNVAAAFNRLRQTAHG